MNLTLGVDRRLVERARKAAAAMGMSLNQAIRLYIEQLAGGDAAEVDIREVRSLSSEAGGRSRGWRFDRDELHERS
jgi:antitoxin component of RelBE/YafQ-DinJ toxin-antitoxin module